MDLENLIFEEEGPTLDFKRDAYILTKAQGEKYEEGLAKLTKDLLAFANSSRRSEAIIVLGMIKPLGERAQVYGIDGEIDDANVQQMVNSKLNHPIEFIYSNLSFEGKRVAVIEVAVRQKRTIYSRKSFGEVMAGAVYVRRGSSTAIASPEQIASMGAQDHDRVLEPLLRVSLVAKRSDPLLAQPVLVTVKPRIYPSEDTLLDYEDPESDVFSDPNGNYYRELAAWDHQRTAAQAFGVLIENASGTVAHDVNVKLSATDAVGALVLFDESALLEKPRRSKRHAHFLPGLTPQDGPAVSAWTEHSSSGQELFVHIGVGKLQPGASICFERSIYVGARVKGTYALSLKGLLYADNVAEPMPVSFAFEVQSDTQQVTADQFSGISRPLVLKAQPKKSI